MLQRLQITDYRFLSLILFALLLGCAAERPPTGGPPDLIGPSILAVIPANESVGIPFEVSFEVIFDELVDPVSVPGSITFLPRISFTTRVRGRRLVITPDNGLRGDQAYVMTLRRGIRDYQGNSLSSATQYLFSTGRSIPTGRISGKVSNTKPKDRVWVGLYLLDSAKDTLYQSLAVRDDGSFDFRYLPNRPFRVAASAGGLADFPESIGRRSYALTSVDSVVVSDSTEHLRMRLGPALTEPQIQSIEWLTDRYLAITFDAEFGSERPVGLLPNAGRMVYGYLLGDSLGDTVTIDLGSAMTRLGNEYTIDPFDLTVATVVDTMAPKLVQSSRTVALQIPSRRPPELPRAMLGRVRFSEPVTLADGFALTLRGKDSTTVGVSMISPIEVEFQVDEPELFDHVEWLGAQVLDYSENTMDDSLLSLTLSYSPAQPTGQIRGRVLGIDGPVIVEARTVSRGALAAWVVTDSSNYLLEGVPPGDYRLFAHAQIGSQPIPFYSGQWEPFSRAAKFSNYPTAVEVRPRWEVDGIDINFKAVDTLPTTVNMEQASP